MSTSFDCASPEQDHNRDVAVDSDIDLNRKRTIESLLAEADESGAILRRLREESENVSMRSPREESTEEQHPIVPRANTWTMSPDDVELHPMTTSDIIRELQMKCQAAAGQARYSRLREFDDEHTITVPYERYDEDSERIAQRREVLQRCFRCCSVCFVGTLVFATVSYVLARYVS